jgi:hypothetical protein
MAKRQVTHFSRAGFPSYEEISEEGQAKPCVYGVPWVNPDTIKTLGRHGEKRTGPKGEPLEAGQYGPRPLA